ncbi:tRNA uridine-5-carboxymethylaminomethyl(34) synthesis GTPase MnmE [Winogradskyella undariae]|uniref:tRNA uridine-5-carboxymethylaminomethyl(34) synthesis GTPase MnmE n=1 Tax=Winogradskyella TaxID=286104 RepID=UPI00156B7FDE|nr:MULTISPECIES: tRNA uridine-5-carboxymethylaminomethyl(34) synthesis GTPase MnmE [Winogradskyella]NRR92381.1 tRNA uridine-5-carboxymethylaminomethyl(34) synthesis GTPase MnmE [Winogradskyella undariae]QNK78567.1 tRNA uridine-5-carboxymethylaminomethyl(34) synthesis GTPase MnmE [Winogradskyella sp. PAMC22761]QXP78405.1 tRNA uridine-5-carboxymethylaminomethyl(34) synthesis GTPase MnmE [Winogradskyella sp. HaHa_3_26]
MHNDTIVALATPSGSGAIAVIRLSGKEAITIASKSFKSVSDKDLNKQKTHTIHLGHIVEGGRTIDEVLVSVFKDPNSYTGENVVEISCHGSSYIQQEIIQLFLRKGCRMATAGEFTLRAFLNGKLDLSQAEAVADLISSDNEASHQIAMQQMRGGFSSEIAKLREELLNFASLIELELDFAEEDVEFADRTQFKQLIARITFVLKRLIDSFAVGNVIKNGIPVAIVGEPNVGKSTLLNALLNEDRAIVSEIAGTTRDTIEDEISIGGIGFRFIDTAGIRDTEDVVESIGIKKTFEKIEQAQVVLFLIGSPQLAVGGKAIANFLIEIEKVRNQFPQKQLLVILNKIDQITDSELATITTALEVKASNVIPISAKTGFGVEELTNKLLNLINTGALRNNETIVTNSRHYDALLKAFEEVQKVQYGLETDLSGDLLAIDIRQALYHFGEITGEITNDDLLGNIFANFCIGK